MSEQETARKNSGEVDEKTIITEAENMNTEAKEATATTEEPQDDEMIYPSGSALFVLSAGLCLCTFVVSPNYLDFFNLFSLISYYVRLLWIIQLLQQQFQQ